MNVKLFANYKPIALHFHGTLTGLCWLCGAQYWETLRVLLISAVGTTYFSYFSGVAGLGRVLDMQCHRPRSISGTQYGVLSLFKNDA